MAKAASKRKHIKKAPKVSRKAPKAPVKERKTFTVRARATFLVALAETCNVTEACRTADITRTAVYVHRNKDPDFAAQWDVAEQMAADRLEREAWRRGVEGYDKPIIHQGEITGTYREYSDRMLEILLKGHRPKYREKVINEHTGPGGGPIQISTTQRIARIESLMEIARRRLEADVAGDALNDD